MSNSPINRNPDLQRLVAEGYEVEIIADHLVIRSVPYVDQDRQVRRGALVSELNEETRKPKTHVIMFAGDFPCDKDGKILDRIIKSKAAKKISEALTVSCSFSSKPPEGYPDYYQKITTYVTILQNEAQAIDPNANARTWRVIPNPVAESPFEYVDTASSRAGITYASGKLSLESVAIVGLGGTGSYVLDLLAKTPVSKIHLFDGDKFGQHNAFRTPGAPSLDHLRTIPFKVDHWAGIYSAMHRGIVPHPTSITPENLHLLRDMKFVFICADAGGAKGAIFRELESASVPFIDTGMGLGLEDDTLHGMLTVTLSTPSKRDHVAERVSLAGDGHENIYAKNIQVADLNMFSAALAVIKYKKLLGFYDDRRHEHFINYMIGGNVLLSEDRA
ncbi:ThiF family adenylyltransferase [Mesorhizobium waimense]|uniref:ThiF family adenylyltransferase n=1 Tax=Mesorhizobium waimense TaxID=1300307 RepID=A0A3A5JXJ0_9HYPH|nr:ThiF family adenylyltransferase [Mesorhizobium waimense]RJT27736.1 ThiF family adenylyltransferase [Mesorhizobium waimense]